MPDRILLLSLAVEEALNREAWAEVRALFDERAKEIAQTPTLTADRLASIQEVEQRIFFRLRLRRSEILSQMSRANKAIKAVRAYAARA